MKLVDNNRLRGYYLATHPQSPATWRGGVTPAMVVTPPAIFICRRGE